MSNRVDRHATFQGQVPEALGVCVRGRVDATSTVQVQEPCIDVPIRGASANISYHDVLIHDRQA